MITNASVTIYRKTGRDKESRADIWQRTVYNNAYLFAKLSARTETRGATSANSFALRVFGTFGAPCGIGDIVATEICHAATPQEAQASGVPCFTVNSVTDNRRGSRGLHHWRVEGA